MPSLKNPFPDLAEATDAATRILALQADLFLLKQEMKTIQQIRRAIWAGSGVVLLNLLMTLTFYWIEIWLHEKGWSALSLALLSFVLFGISAAVCMIIALRVSQDRKPEKGTS